MGLRVQVPCGWYSGSRTRVELWNPFRLANPVAVHHHNQPECSCGTRWPSHFARQLFSGGPLNQLATKNWLIYGCGYLGERVASRWSTDGGRVFVTTRHLGKAERFAERGWIALVGDITDELALPVLPEITFDGVLFAVGRDLLSGRSHHEVFVKGCRNALAQVEGRCRRFYYVSSTGVYGDMNGDWLDERSPVAPATPGGEACAEAEQLLQNPNWHSRHSVLRMAGLYGPGRVPRLSEIVAGVPIAVSADGYLNLVHVDDAARVVEAMAAAVIPPALLCVSDGQPVPRREYLSEIARRIGAPPPRFVEPDVGSPRGRGTSNKRISNKLLRERLRFQFLFPSYREGLAAILGPTAQLG